MQREREETESKIELLKTRRMAKNSLEIKDKTKNHITKRLKEKLDKKINTTMLQTKKFNRSKESMGSLKF